MKTAFYSGASGLTAQQNAMDTIGNNLANINTDGYKKQGVSFDSLLYREMYANAPGNPLNGSGVKAVSAGIDFGQGLIRETGGELDFAIMGEGLFAVNNNDQVQYTRDGNFSISRKGNYGYLVAADGAFVLDSRKNKIRLKVDSSTGQFDLSEATDKVGVFRFDNPGRLEPASGNRYAPTPESGEAVRLKAKEYTIRSGCLEGSGTNLTDEMANLIAAQRAYQLSARVVQTADENEQVINNLRR
ncbi:MAG: flagellar hook-basal body protein [Peptococcaceae bacterium]|nr:flagellar hook-basal body protein [Peptococcaceae bacterium]